MGTLDGRSVVVTGAGRGLGRAYAIAAAAEGASVVVNDIDGREAQAVAAEITAEGGTAVANDDSVATADGATHVVATALDAFGSLDGLVNNAGVIASGPPWEMTAEQIDRLVDVNVRGVLHVGTAAIRAMRERGGVIVNVTSGAHVGMPGLGIYGATKGAVASVTYGWALDLEDTGIRVIGFSPLGRTRMGNDAPTLPDPATIAPAVAFLVGPGSAGLSGQVVRFDGRRLSLLDPPRFGGPFVEREHWTVADVQAAVADELASTIGPVGMAGRTLTL